MGRWSPVDWSLPYHQRKARSRNICGSVGVVCLFLFGLAALWYAILTAMPHWGEPSAAARSAAEEMRR